jgi:hypothetical protein
MRREIFAVPAVLVGAFMVMLLAELPASGQTASPCTGDMKEFCGTVTPGGGRLLQCYETNKDKVSANCRGWAEAAKSRGATVKKACSKTIDARCNFEKGDPLEMLECLQSNYIDLTYECREMLNEFKGRYPLPVK